MNSTATIGGFMREWWPLIAFALLHTGALIAWVAKTGASFKFLSDQVDELKQLWGKTQTLGEKMVELAVRLETVASSIARSDSRFERVEGRLTEIERRLPDA